MNNFLRAHLRHLQKTSITLLKRPYATVVCGLMLIASMLAPTGASAQFFGFSGGAPVATPLVCSGGTATVTFTGGECSVGTGPDWSANYQVEFSTDGGAIFNPAPGASSGVISHAANNITYISPVLTTTICTTVVYRIQLTSIISHCIPGNIAYTSPNATVNLCPTPAPISGPSTVCVGSTITLTTTSTTGTWVSSATGVATVNATTGVVGGISTVPTNTATISYTMSGCSATHAITVHPTPVITGPSVVCLGSTATFSLVTPLPGTWSSTNAAVGTIDAATGSYTASATTTGTSTISYITPDGCGAGHIITVNPTPDPIGCFGSSTMCFGDTLTLCNTSTGGVWSSGSPGIITVVDATNGVITPTSISSPGTATISYTLLGCSSTHVFTVSAGPTSITGPSVMCEGETITLTGAPGGGVYTDGSGGMFSVNAITGAVLALPGSGGSVGVVNYSIGSCNITHTITVNVTPSAIVGGPNLCVGQTVTFTSTPAGGLWTMSSVGPSPLTPIGVFSGTTTATSVGTANITYTIPSTGCRTSTTVTVGVAPDPITGPSVVCQNSSITLCNTTFGGDWGTVPGGTGAATVSPTFATCTNFTGTAPGTVIVTYSLSASGCSTSDTITVNAAPTPITGPDYICSGLTANYASSPGAGLWTVIPGTGNATITPATGVATGGPIGTVTIRYTLPNGCNVSRVVTVAATPTPIVGVLAICVGQATTLTSSPLGGTWYGTDTSVAFVDTLSGIVTGRSPGAVIVHYVLQPQGCEAIAVVTVNPLPPAITGPSGVCLGECVTLSNSLPGGTWTSSLPSRATVSPSTGSSTSVCGVGVGTTNISYADPSTGCVTSRVFTVHPLPLDITGTLAICYGATTTLTNSSPGGPGTWTSSNPAIAPVNPTTGVVTGMGVGTANITYTVPTGCDTFVTVTVNPLPAAITGGLHTCVGSCRTLSSASPGGTWSTTFPTIATVHPTLGTLCGVSVGTTFITYTLPTGCITVGVVTVEPTPPNPTGLTSICEGSTTTWTHAEPGGTWSSSDTDVAEVFIGTGFITGIAPGTANITYTTAIGCATFVTITVNPVPPAITGIQYLCVNNTTTLSNTMGGGSWWSSNTAVATVGSGTGVVTGITGLDTVSIHYIMPTGCKATATVTVYPIPTISGSVLVCPGVASTLTATPAGGLWTSSPTIIATIGSLSGVVMGVNAGTVNITYILASTCMAHVTATVQPLPAVITGPTQVCQGSTIQLFNFTGGGGTWSSGNPSIATVGSTGIVTGVSPGTVAITFTANTTGCVISTIITVNPLPGAIGGPPSVCVGSTILLSSSPAGGTWSASGGHTTIGSSTGIVTGVSAGVDDITYTLPTGCFITRGVTVEPLPDNITSATSLHVCHGNTLTVYSGPAGGVWSTSATNITLTPLATGSDTATIVGLSPGPAIITYMLPSGCYDTGLIIVDSLPGPIGGLMNLCVNDSTTLTNPSPGGTWTSDNIFIAVINPSSGLLATVSAGTVMITYTLPTGCFITGVVTINPIPQPITGPLAICVNDVVTLSNVTTGGTWVSSNIIVATIGSASGIVTGLAPGTSIITYTLPSSCSRTAILTVNPLPTPITGIFSICRGDTTILSSTPPIVGTWSSSHPDTAFIFMPTGEMIGIRAGTATITYTLPTGCMRTQGVTINPIPSATGITGNRVLCMGDTATLTRPPGFIGGTWASSPTTVATINPTTGLWGAVGVVGGVATTATITFTSVHGCDTFITVTVNPLPAAITGVMAVCIGNTTTLTSTPAGGTWSGGLSTVGTINPTTGVFTGIGAGAIDVTYTLPGTGCYVTATITVNPLPNIIVAPNQICLNDTVIVSNTDTGGTWVTNLPSILDVTTITTDFDSARVIGVGVGTAIVTYTLPTGCFRTHTITVNPLPNPIVGPDSVCLHESITLSSSPSTGSPGMAGTWSNTPTGWVTVTVISVDGDTVNVRGDTVGTSYITYTNDYGCSVRDSVIVLPLPDTITGTIGGVLNLCVGFSDTLFSATGGGTWSISDTTLLTTIATINPVTGVVTAITPGVATATYSLGTGCYVTATVVVHPIPDIEIVAYPSIICKYANTVLEATGAGTGGTYSWSPGTGLSSTVGPVVTANPLVSTTYTVTGTTAAGCSDTAIVTVWVDSLLNDITISGQDSICMGDCTVLIAHGRESTYFEWRPSVGLSCVICDTVTACPTSTTIYNALAIDSLGCRDSLYFTVTVMPLPVLSVNPNPIIVCNGSTTTATVVDLAGGPGTKFAWFPNAFISPNDTGSTITFSNTSNLVYRVTGITSFGCYDSIKVPVTVLDSAFNSINKDTVICAGSSAQLYVISFNPDGARSDYYWFNGIPEEFRHIPNPVVSPLVTTTYSVAVTPNVCWPDTLYTTVVVVPGPDFTLTASPSGNVAPGTEVALTATLNNNVVLSSYAWSLPNTVSCVECFRTLTAPLTTTTYTFTATSVYGCSDSKTITINVGCENSQVYIANSFTPNGDGMNDRFYVQGKGISRVNKFLIFSRWGEMVYERYNIDANDPSVGWDGQFKDVMLPPGVYYYVAEATCNLGQMYTYKGDVTIVK